MFGPKKYLGQKKFCCKRIKAPKNLGPESLAKITSVTTEILLILTNVTMTYTGCPQKKGD